MKKKHASINRYIDVIHTTTKQPSLTSNLVGKWWASVNVYNIQLLCLTACGNDYRYYPFSPYAKFCITSLIQSVSYHGWPTKNFFSRDDLKRSQILDFCRSG